MARCLLLTIQILRARRGTPTWAQKASTAPAPALRMLHPTRYANSRIRLLCSAVVLDRFLIGAGGDATAISVA